MILSVSTNNILMGKRIIHKHILAKFGERMQQMRKSKGITQEELAARLAIHRINIGLKERIESEGLK